MSLATVMAGLALPDVPDARAARRFLVANGAVLPFLAFQMYAQELIWLASLWAITFPVQPGRSRGGSARPLTD